MSETLPRSPLTELAKPNLSAMDDKPSDHRPPNLKSRHDLDSANVEPWTRNLLHTFAELVEHLGKIGESFSSLGQRSGTSPTDRVSARSLEGTEPEARFSAETLDILFTLSALTQILDDFLHRGFLGVRYKAQLALRRPEKLDRYLGFLPRGLRRPVRFFFTHGVIRWVAVATDTIFSLPIRLRGAVLERKLFALSDRLHELAADVAGGSENERIRTSFGDVISSANSLCASPKLSRRALKIPSCFKDFDFHAEDCLELVRKWVAQSPNRDLPVTVIGIRTSGNYLAPFVAGFLKNRGFSDVAVRSVRQKIPLFSRERSWFRSRTRNSGVFLLIDDPPVTGTAQLLVARDLEKLGASRNQVVALILQEPTSPLFMNHREDSETEDLLHRPHIVLKKREWRVHRLFGPLDSSLRTTGETESSPLQMRVPLENERSSGYRLHRCHEKALFATDPADESTFQFVKGTGIGWFEEHVFEITQKLSEFIPPTTRWAEGFFSNPWISGATLQENQTTWGEKIVKRAARYVGARARGLSFESGVSGDLIDRHTGWKTLAGTFAPSYSFLAPISVPSLRKRLSRIAEGRPRCCIDAKMGPAKWMLPGDGSEAIKVDFDEHDFDRMDLGVFDPAYDLAAFCVEGRIDRDLEAVLLDEYRTHSGDERAPSALPCYQIMVGSALLAEIQLVFSRGGSISLGFSPSLDRITLAREEASIERYLESVANRRLAEALAIPENASVNPVRENSGIPKGSRIFAIDVDGVLEDATLGFNATTPQGAFGLHLLKHAGFHPILNTGRSLEEVRDRSRSYGLYAGIAEYGSVVWIQGETDEVLSLIEETEKEQLDELGSFLTENHGEEFVLDPAFRHSIRVFVRDRGRRRRAPVPRLDEICRKLNLDRIRMIPGDAQIDIVGASCNKGRGLEQLRTKLSPSEVHAVGDTGEDVSMFQVADRAYTPANVRSVAKEALGSSLFVAGGRFQRGFLEVARHATRCAGKGDPDLALPVLTDPLLQCFGLRDQSRYRRIAQLLRPGLLRHFVLGE